MAPPLVRNLPKVTEYVRNVGKSVQYATIDYFKGSMSETSEFMENNQELFKDIAAAVKDYRGTLRAADRSIRKSKIYEAGTELKKTLFESIKTGKFYDPAREDYYRDKASGSLGDMSDMDDWGFDNSQFDIDDGSSMDGGGDLLSSTVKDATTAQASIIAKSSEYLAEMEKANTRLLFAQGEKLYATVNNGLANTQSMLDRVNKFLEGPLTTHMENSKRFYETVTPLIQDISGQLKELTEMQRNLYKKQQSDYKESQYSRVGGSSPDLREYAKEIKKNFMDVLGPEAQMLLGNDMGDGSNMLMALVANPLAAIPNFLVKSIVPMTIKKSLETLDKSFSSLFANFIARMNNAAKDSGDNIIMQYLGRIFGLKIDNKTTYDPSKYEKGPVPFDGITRKTIVDIIPGHLARIEAALTGKQERVFDYETGKWTTADKLEKDFRDRKKRAVRDAFWDSGEEARENIRRYKRSKDSAARSQGDSYEKAYETIINKIYEDNGVFRPYDKHGRGDDKQNAWDYYGVDKNTFLTIAAWLVGHEGDKNRKTSAYQIAPNVLKSKEDFARYLREMENKGYGNVRHLYNNAYNFGTDSKKGTGIRNIITDATDQYNRNIFWYLRGIYAELTTIRENGGMGGSKSRRGGPRRPFGPQPDPREMFENGLNKELRDAALAQEAKELAQNQGNEDTDVNMLDREMEDKDTLKSGRLATSAKGFLNSLLEANSVGEKFKVIQANLRELTKKPGEALTAIIGQADRQVFRLLFGGKEGQEILDEDGNRVKGLLDYMILKVRSSFDKLNDWLDEEILGPLKEKLGVKSFGELFKRFADRIGLTKAAGFVKDKVQTWTRPTLDRMKAKLGWGWGQFKGSMSRTYGTAYNNVKARFAPAGPASMKFSDYYKAHSGDFNSDDVAAAWEILKENKFSDDAVSFVREQLNVPDYVQFKAHGGLVTRRGLAVISPGERVVPVGGRVTQRNNLLAEKAFARRIGLPSGLSYYASGTPTSTDAELQKAKETVKTVTSEVMGDTKHKGIANVIASSLLGGGFSLLTGLIGGPLLGAAAGAAFGITQNSGTVQRMLFGEEVVDKDGNPTGERKGGIISKKAQDAFKKYFPSMKDFGLAGAVAGLFTPFGLVGGLMAGSAIGFAKENESFQEYIFGKKDENGERDGGLISKKFRDTIKKSAPRMLVGAAGAALLGPFGLLGNAVLGSAIGLSTTTDTFHKVVFGEDDGNGKKKGGLVPALYRGIIVPLYNTGKKFVESSKEFFDKKIAKPIKEAVPAIIQMIKNGITGIGDHVKDFLSNMFENTIGRPLADFLEHTIFDNVRKWMGRLLKAPLALAKGIISAPFSLLGAVGNNIRTTQIAKGTAGDMTAQQRMEWRDKHRFRMFGKEVVGHDKYRNLDKMLVGMEGQKGLDTMKEMRENLNLYLNTRRELGKQAADIVKQAGEIISEFFNSTMAADDNTRTVYQSPGCNKHIKAMHKAVAEGDISGVNNEVGWILRKGYITPDQMTDFMNSITPLVAKVADLRQKQKDTKRAQENAMGNLSRLSGGTLTNVKNFRRFSRLLNTEIDAREAEEAKKRAEGEQADATPEGQITGAINDGNAKMFEKADRMIDVLKNINAYLAMQAGADDVSDILGETPPNKSLNKLIAKRARKARKGRRNAATVTDDVIGGDAQNAVDAVNEGLHTIETDEGEQGLADSQGNIQPTKSASKLKQFFQRRRQEREDQRTFRERLNDSFFGKAFKGVTSFLGTAKDGLFGVLGKVLNKFSPVLDILKWVFVGGTAIAAIGHGSGWLKESVFPWLKETVAPWLIGTQNEDGVLVGGIRGAIFGNKTGENGTYEGGIVSGLVNKFSGWWNESAVGKFFNNLWDTWKTEGVIGLVRPVLDWYASGGKKFYENIITPLVSAFVQHIPDLAGAIVSGIIDGIKKLFFGDKDKDQEDTGLITKDSEGNISTTYKVGSTPTGTRFTTTTNTTTGSRLGLSKAASTTIGRTSSGEALWVDANGNTAVKNGNTFVYTDGSGTSTDRNSFTLLKDQSYARFANKSTLAGNVVSGIGNNFLAGLTGFRATASKIPTFSTKSILNSAKKIPSLNIFKTTGNAIATGAKTGWNATVGAGKVASTAGNSLRNRLLALIGKGPIAQANAQAAAEEATRLANVAANGMDVDSLLDWNTVTNTAANSADNVAGAAANASTNTGLMARIGNAVKSLGSKITTGVSNTKVGQAVGSAVNSAKTTVSNLVGKATSAGSTFVSKIKNTILNFFDDLAKNSTVMKIFKSAAKVLGTTIDDTIVGKALRTVGEKLVAKIGQNVVGSAVKSLLNAFAAIPLVAIALAVGYFVSGVSNAHNILGISKDYDIPIHYTIIAGLVNAVKNALPGAGIILSFIPTSTIIDIFVDFLLPALGWDDTELTKMREETQKQIDELNAELPEDEQVESVEEYNEKTNPGLWQKIKNSFKNFFSGGDSDSESSNSGSGRINSSATVLKKLRESNKKMSGKLRSGRGSGHLYQGDPRLENVRFGNSTLGKAGCGPIAAANLMGGNLAAATQAAIPYQTADGGVTPDYFANTLGGVQTTNKKSMMNAIKNGKPTVLLGNSGRENGTPFGANDHYITAIGMDRRGNIIVEDPDLPGSSYKYPASRVLNDASTGVITGMRRGMRRRGRRRGWGFAREGGDPTTTKQKVSKITVRAYQIIHSSEGDYASVNKNDNGAVSIGKLQWHATRAMTLLQKIANASGQSASVSMLGQSLYNEIANGANWSKRTVTQSEADKIGKFISTETGKSIQDLQGYEDIAAYITNGQNLGLKDENVLIFYADMYNQSPSAAKRVAKAAISASGGNPTLDDIYQQSIVDKTFSKYKTRRDNVYKMLKNSSKVGWGTVTLDIAATSAYIEASSGIGATVDSSDTSNSFESAFTSKALDISKAIFGDKMVEGIVQMKGGSITNTGSNVGLGLSGGLINIPSNGYGTVGSPTQQGLVDQMASIKGKINYSLSGPQDPDKGSASCASTVGWAYRKALGLTGMSASSTTQSSDNRFSTIWTNSGSGFNSDNILQPGDVMYYNWDQTRNNGKMQHTEMYAGDGTDWSHGGSPKMGPTKKSLDDYRRKHLMMVRRYNGFIGNDQSGSSRRRGFARSMTSGVSASISDNAKRVISQYGISTSSSTPRYGSISASDEGAAYAQFLSVIIDLLAAIADNTKGLADLQKALANRGVDVDYTTLEKAAANARKRAARARNRQNCGYKPTISSASTFTSSDAQDLMNSPTGFMVQAMEALAKE